MVVIAIPAISVPQVIKDSVEKGVKLAIIISAGFSETGEEGKKLEEEIINIAKGKLRIIGPNGLGVYDPYNQIDTFFVKEERVLRPPKGKIAVISQSGAIALAIMEWLAFHNIGVSKIISYGNKIDIDEVDLLYELKEDPNTKYVFMYIEGIKPGRGREFIKIAKEFNKLNKKIIDFEILERSKGGRVKKLKIKFENSDTIIEGELNIRKFFYKNGYLKSSLFYLQKKNDSLIIIGGGFGHGIGLCQYGAGGRALKGQTYYQILNAYLSGVEIKKLY